MTYHRYWKREYGNSTWYQTFRWPTTPVVSQVKEAQYA